MKTRIKGNIPKLIRATSGITTKKKIIAAIEAINKGISLRHVSAKKNIDVVKFSLKIVAIFPLRNGKKLIYCLFIKDLKISNFFFAEKLKIVVIDQQFCKYRQTVLKIIRKVAINVVKIAIFGLFSM
jgi:hypothetical protein